MAKIENLTVHYTITGLDKVRSLLEDLDSALNDIQVNVFWSDDK